ncbi:hypothetical protein B0H12DRAFT_1326643 [Mycena haematopus]|nr:hypothetical protein B0H12DRAFT_1326643 [Mycena haematopus]
MAVTRLLPAPRNVLCGDSLLPDTIRCSSVPPNRHRHHRPACYLQFSTRNLLRKTTARYTCFLRDMSDTSSHLDPCILRPHHSVPHTCGTETRRRRIRRLRRLRHLQSLHSGSYPPSYCHSSPSNQATSKAASDTPDTPDTSDTSTDPIVVPPVMFQPAPTVAQSVIAQPAPIIAPPASTVAQPMGPAPAIASLRLWLTLPPLRACQGKHILTALMLAARSQVQSCVSPVLCIPPCIRIQYMSEPTFLLL